MPSNQSEITISQAAVIDHRRRQVAAMRLRGLTQREIVRGLETAGLMNGSTGKPWALGTVNADLKAVHEEWRARAAEDIGTHKARILAELAEVKRRAWADAQLTSVLRAIEKECKVLGLDAPEKQIILDETMEVLLASLPVEYQEAARRGIAEQFGIATG